MKNYIPIAKFNRMLESVSFISDSDKENDLIRCAERMLNKGVTLRDLIKLNKLETTELCIDIIVRKSAAQVAANAVKQYGYTFTKKDYELYFNAVEDYDTLRLKDKVIEKVRKRNWVDNYILEKIKLTNDLKLQGADR